MVDDWELDLEPAAFLERVRRLARDVPYPGAVELVETVRATVPVGYLSNTNALQWEANYAATPIARGL